MSIYSKTLEILHQKLLQARSRDHEDRIVNLMLAEVRKNQLKKVQTSKIKNAIKRLPNEN